jgi:hypothetical protein
MKMMSKFFALAVLVLFSMGTFAQRIKTTSGNPEILKNESSVNIEFTYDKISVGKFDREEDYIKKKTEEYNSREPGRGDIWAKNWINDRQARYEPKFIDLFMINSHMTVNKDAKYTLIFKTRSMEPGYNIGGGFGMYGGRKNAEIDAEAVVVETNDRSKVLCTITIENAPGGVWGGYDYDTGSRIAESYAISGKKLAKYMK